MVAKRALNVASAILALLIMALLVWEASDAAFTAQTSEDASVGAAEITLTDDDHLSTLPFAPVLLAGQQSIVECVVVTYDDSTNQAIAAGPPPTGEVRLWGTVTADPDVLAPNVTIDVGAGADCAAATADLGNEASTTLDALPADYASATGSWTPANAGDTQTYAVQVTLDGATPDALQGAVANFTLTWEVQTP